MGLDKIFFTIMNLVTNSVKVISPLVQVVPVAFQDSAVCVTLNASHIPARIRAFVRVNNEVGVMVKDVVKVGSAVLLCRVACDL